MVIEEEKVISDYVIQHSGVKNQKKGVRRFQSYAVAPTRSGMVGEEVGEAAEQRQRIEEKKYDDEHEDRGEQQKAPEQPKKKTFREVIEERKKAKWARNQKSLYRHRKHYTTQELKDHMYRLGVEENLKTRIGDKTENASRRGMQILKNLAAAGVAGVGIYNVAAGARNAYNNYHGYNKKPWPTIKLGGGGNKKGGKGHSAFDGEYLAHFGVPHMKWGHRYHQSYDTVPTRSGMVGIEHFQKTEKEDNTEESKTTEQKLEEYGFKRNEFYDGTVYMSMSTKNSRGGKTEIFIVGDKDGMNEDVDAKQMSDAAHQLMLNDDKIMKNVKSGMKTDMLIGDRVPWLYEDDDKYKGMTNRQLCDDLDKRIGKDVSYRLMSWRDSVTAELSMDDGGLFYGHVINCEVDPKTGKTDKHVSING